LFAAGWALMYWSLGVSYALTVLLAIPEASLLIRLFIVHHDCGHGSFFRSKQPADVVGSFLGRRACASCRRPPPGHLTVVSETQRPIPKGAGLRVLSGRDRGRRGPGAAPVLTD
jgi:hypothetical protein